MLHQQRLQCEWAFSIGITDTQKIETLIFPANQRMLTLTFGVRGPLGVQNDNWLVDADMCSQVSGQALATKSWVSANATAKKKKTNHHPRAT